MEEADKPQEDIDIAFEAVVKRALTPFVPTKEQDQPSLEESYRGFRTRLIVSWILSNPLVILIVTTSETSKFKIHSEARIRTAAYFKTILYVTAVLSHVRFIGCFWCIGRTGILRCFSKR